MAGMSACPHVAVGSTRTNSGRPDRVLYIHRTNFALCCLPCTQAQAALAGAVVALAASPGEDLLLVALASARLLSLDIGRLDALQVQC